MMTIFEKMLVHELHATNALLAQLTTRVAELVEVTCRLGELACPEESGDDVLDDAQECAWEMDRNVTPDYFEENPDEDT